MTQNPNPDPGLHLELEPISPADEATIDSEERPLDNGEHAGPRPITEVQDRAVPPTTIPVT